jgi:hypothetical protein
MGTVFNFNELIADAHIIKKIIKPNEDIDEADPTILNAALKKYADTIQKIKGLQPVQTAPCSPEVAVPNIEIKEGDPGYTSLPNGYITTVDFGRDGTITPLVSQEGKASEQGASTGKTADASVGTDEVSKDITVDDAIKFYERDWLGRKDDFKTKFIDSRNDFKELLTQIEYKKGSIGKVKEEDLKSKVTQAKTEFNNIEKEINKVDKQLASLKTNNGSAEEIQRVDAARNTMIKESVSLKEALDKALYEKEYQSKALDTLKELDEIIKMINVEQQKEQQDKKQRVLGIIDELNGHNEELNKFLIDNTDTIVNLPFTNKEILKLIDIINKGMKEPEETPDLKDLKSKLQQKITIDNQPIPPSK